MSEFVRRTLLRAVMARALMKQHPKVQQPAAPVSLSVTAAGFGLKHQAGWKQEQVDRRDRGRRGAHWRRNGYRAVDE